jgi:hypothetical protein
VNPFYKDYEWIDGLPRGIGKLTNEEVLQRESAFKIVSDPYRKRISIEKYKNRLFETIIYDTQQLDFRSLRQEGRSSSWERETTLEKTDQIRAIIRDQDDRIILIETQYFEKGYCRECQIHSPQGSLLSIHKLYYCAFGDAFDGVILYDSQMKQVMVKKYEVDGVTGEFTSLLAEAWGKS